MIKNAKTLTERPCEQDESKIHEIKVEINGEYYKCDKAQGLPPCNINRDMMDAFNYSLEWQINNDEHKKEKIIGQGGKE